MEEKWLWLMVLGVSVHSHSVRSLGVCGKDTCGSITWGQWGLWWRAKKNKEPSLCGGLEVEGVRCGTGEKNKKKKEGRGGGGGHDRCSGDSGGPDVTGFSKASSL